MGATDAEWPLFAMFLTLNHDSLAACLWHLCKVVDYGK